MGQFVFGQNEKGEHTLHYRDDSTFSPKKHYIVAKFGTDKVLYDADAEGMRLLGEALIDAASEFAGTDEEVTIGFREMTEAEAEALPDL